MPRLYSFLKTQHSNTVCGVSERFDRQLQLRLSPPMTWPLGPLLQRVTGLLKVICREFPVSGTKTKLEETMGLPAKVSVLVPELIGNDLAALAWSLAKLETVPEAARVILEVSP